MSCRQTLSTRGMLIIKETKPSLLSTQSEFGELASRCLTDDSKLSVFDKVSFIDNAVSDDDQSSFPVNRRNRMQPTKYPNILEYVWIIH